MVSIIEQKSEEIVTRFKNAGVPIEETEVSSRLTLLMTEFKVPVIEAVRTVTGYFRQKHNLKFDDMKGTQGPAGVVQIGSLKEDNSWVSVRAKVIQIWEPMNEVIHQTGLVGDESGVIKFTIFAKNSSLGSLEEGKSYNLNNFVTSTWQNQISIKGNKNSSIQEIQEDIKAQRSQDVIIGVITHLSQGSGLIKRCPECNRKLMKGLCGEHGKVEGFYDMRIKAVMEPYGSNTPIDLIMNKDVTEKLTGTTLTQAKEMATEAMDVDIVQSEFEKTIPGKYYQITGSIMPSNNMIVESITPITNAIEDQIKTIITALGGV